MDELALIGPTSAGKTVYLTMLKSEIAGHGWTIVANDQTEKEIQSIRRNLIRGLLPPPTQPGTIRDLRFDIYRSSGLMGNVSKLGVTLRDIAGGEWNPYSESAAFEDFYERHLTLTRGVLVLVDGNRGRSAEYVNFFSGVLNKLKRLVLERCRQVSEWNKNFGTAEMGRDPNLRVRPNPPRNFYFGLCLTKCDQREETLKNAEEGLGRLSSIEAARKVIGERAWKEIDEFAHLKGVDMRCFACSALGFCREEQQESRYVRASGLLVPQLDKNGKLRDPSRLFPEHIAEPFLWLVGNVWCDLFGGRVQRFFGGLLG